MPLSRAQAQLTFSFGGGASFPASNVSNSYNTGYNVLASLGIGTSSPVNLRVDGMFNQMTHQSAAPVGNLQIWTLNADLVYKISHNGGITPYLIGGAGYYNTSYHVTVSGSDISAGGNTSANNFGLNGGVGLRIGGSGLAAFVEGRYHYIFTGGHDIGFVPLTFGVTL